MEVNKMGKAVNIRNVPDEAADLFSKLSEQAKEKLGIKQGQLFSEGVRLLEKWLNSKNG